MLDGPCLWSLAGSTWGPPELLDLGGIAGAYPVSMNDSGQILGRTYDGSSYGAAFWASHDTPPVVVPNSGRAGRITQDGTIVGRVDDGTYDGTPALWVPDDPESPTSWTQVDLPMPTGYLHGSAVDMNSQGQVAGGLTGPGLKWHVFVWAGGPSGWTATDLGVPANSVDGNVAAWAINDNGDVAGSTLRKLSRSKSTAQPYVWKNGQWVDLCAAIGMTTTPLGDPWDINNSGVLVGGSWGGTGAWKMVPNG